MRNVSLIFIISLLAVLFAGTLTAQWVQTNGPYGGDVTSLVVADSALYAGTSGGVFRSADNGSTWIQVNNGLSNRYINSLIAYETCLFAGTYDGIFLSIDQGAHWMLTGPSNWGLFGNGAVLIANLYVSECCGRGCGYQQSLAVSTDDGGTWTDMSETLGWEVYAFTSIDSIHIAGNYGGIHLSADGGLTWMESSNGLPSNVWVKALTLSDNILFAGTDRHGIFHSIDSGATWTAISEGLPKRLPDTTRYSEIISLATVGNGVFAGIRDNGIYRTTDGGTIWTRMNVGLPPASSVPTIAVSGTNIFAGNTGDVFCSQDFGLSWIGTTLPIQNTYVSALAVVGTTLIAGVNGGTWRNALFRSTDDGTTWLEPALTGRFVSSFVRSGVNIFAGCDSGRILISTNNGIDWTQPGRINTNAFTLCLAVSGTNLFAGTLWSPDGVYRSTDNGVTWTTVNTGLPQNFRIRAIAVNEQNIFLGNEGGIYRSTDQGNEWTQINTGLPEYPRITTIATSELGIFVGRDVAGSGTPGIFRSTDDGMSWTPLSTSYIQSINQIIGVGGTNLFAGTDNGVYVVDGNSGTWRQVSEGMVPSNVSALAADNTMLFAGTWGAGIWKRSLSEMITDVQTPAGELPSEYTLRQNYPNPFNPSTTIRYQLPTQSHVTLKVFDVLGREVAMLVDGVEEPGYKSVSFNVEAIHESPLPSGVYFYRIQAGSPSTNSGRRYIETKKLLLIK